MTLAARKTTHRDQALQDRLTARSLGLADSSRAKAARSGSYDVTTPSPSTSVSDSSDDEDCQSMRPRYDVEDIVFSDITNIRNCRASFGVGAFFAFHRAVEIRETKTAKGKGLFARVRIPTGTLIWHNHDHFVEGAVTMEQMDQMNDEGRPVMKRYCFQVDDDLFVGPTTEGEVTRDARWYMNHSCDPNAWFVGDRKMVACRDIEAEEEICFDYATSETTSDRVPQCMCGTTKCRRRVRATDWRSSELQDRYAGHFMSYIQRRLDG